MDFAFSTIWFHIPGHCPLCNTFWKFRNSIALFCNHLVKIWSECWTLHTDDWMILLLGYKAGGAMKTLNIKTPHATSNYFWRQISFNLMNNYTFLSSPHNLLQGNTVTLTTLKLLIQKHLPPATDTKRNVESVGL